MESINVRQRLRPIRYAFLIRANDHAACLKAVSLNTVLWGGLFNPIVPVTPDEECAGLLKEFDPDYLVDLTSEPLPATIATEFEHRIVSADDIVQADEPTGPPRRRLKLGFGMRSVLRFIRENDLRDAKESRAALAVGVPEEWKHYAGAAFGTFSDLPDLGTNVTAYYREILLAKEVPFDPAADVDYDAWVFPIQSTGYGIRHLGGFASWSSHIVYIGDYTSVAALAEFWNIRATGREIWFVPFPRHENHRRMIDRVMKAGSYPINPQVQNRAYIQKGRGISEADFLTVTNWIGSLNIAPLVICSSSPRFGMESEQYVGDIRACDLEARDGEEMSFLDEGHMTPVKLIEPPYVGDDIRYGENKWAIELNMGNPYRSEEWICQVPRVPGANDIVRRHIVGGGSWDSVRLGRNGVVLAAESSRNSIYPSPVKTIDVFTTLLQKATGLDASPSQPGRYAAQIIKKMGSLQFDCRLFKLRGVREVIDRLSNGSTLTQGNMYQAVMSTTPDKFGQNWRDDLYQGLVIRRDRWAADFTGTFAELLEKRVIRPGMTFTCSNCNSTAWYHVSEFAEEYACRFCFERERVQFGSAKEWHYKADGLFQVPKSAEGSLATILSLWRLEEMSHARGGHYCTGMNLCAKGGNVVFEIDYCYLATDFLSTSYELVIGEAKGFMDYDVDKLSRLTALADKFSPKPYIAVSTLKDAFSDAEKGLLRDVVTKGYKLMPLTRLELDPYDLHKRFEAAPHKYAHRLSDSSENLIFLNIR